MFAHVYAGTAAAPPHPRVVAIGNFDGVHLGHQSVLAQAKTIAQRRQLPLCVYTFDPAPTAILAPDRHQPRICPLAMRLKHLGEVGVDEIVVERFSHEFAAIPARQFADERLKAQLQAAALVVGHDFRFGQGRIGHAKMLAEWQPDLEIKEVEAFSLEGVVSSSRIRKLVAAGEVETAARLLGRPHVISGPIVKGDQRGRTIGFPTANVQSEVELLPAFGVYACVATIGNNTYHAVTNIGLRPTFAGTRVSVEAHLLDTQGDLYGAQIDVSLLARIREERKFSGIDALVTQIKADVITARSLLATP